MEDTAMTKKAYMQPTLKVFKVQQRCRILAGSGPLRSVSTPGLDTDTEFIYDDKGGIPGTGW